MGSAPMKFGSRTQLSRRCWSHRSVQLHLKAWIRNQRAAGGGKSRKFPGSDDLAKPHQPEGRGRLGGSSGLARSLGPPDLQEDGEPGKRRGVCAQGAGPTPPPFLFKTKLRLSFPVAAGRGRHETLGPLSSGLQHHTRERGLQGPATHPGLDPGWQGRVQPRGSSTRAGWREDVRWVCLGSRLSREARGVTLIPGGRGGAVVPQLPKAPRARAPGPAWPSGSTSAGRTCGNASPPRGNQSRPAPSFCLGPRTPHRRPGK